MNIRYISLLFALFLLSSPLLVNAQMGEWLQLNEEELGDGRIRLVGKNVGYAPLTVSLDFRELKNFETNVKLPHMFVVEPGEDFQNILELTPSKASRMGAYEYQFGFYLGNALKTDYDEDHEYLLPFPAKKSYYCGQGYNGRFSHSGMYCLDFDMPVGSDVSAARGGVVVDIKEDSNRGCKSSKCQQDGNYVLIYHDDGTFGNYVHLKYNGAKVKLGDKVEAGQVIASSGNTGWSSGPHLHFEVYRSDNNKRVSIPTKFKLHKSQKGEVKEGVKYTAVR